MNILFLHPNFPGQFLYLSQTLASNPANNVVFITSESQTSLPNVHKIVCKTPRESKSKHAYISSLEKKVLVGQEVHRAAAGLSHRGFVPDIIYGHPGWGSMLFMRDLFPQAKIITYCEWFFNAQGQDMDFDPAFPLSPETACGLRTGNTAFLIDLLSCDAAVSPTLWQRSQFPREFQNKIQVIYDGVDSDIYKPVADAKLILPDLGLDLSETKEIITYVARGMEPMRGFPQFMQAIALVQQQRPDCHVVIVGADRVAYGQTAGSYKDAALKTLPLDMSRIHFTGLLQRGLYRKVLQASSVHVYLTKPYVVSWSLIEAMACGCLIVASDTAPVKEVIDDGKNGLLVDFFSPQAIADRIIEALSSHSKLTHLMMEARNTVLERYSLRKNVPKQISFLQSFLP